MIISEAWNNLPIVGTTSISTAPFTAKFIVSRCVFAKVEGILGLTVPSIIWVGVEWKEITRSLAHKNKTDNYSRLG